MCAKGEKSIGNRLLFIGKAGSFLDRPSLLAPMPAPLSLSGPPRAGHFYFFLFQRRKNCKHAEGVVFFAPSFDDIAIHGIPVPARPELGMLDGTIAEAIGTLATSRTVVDGVDSHVLLPGVESTCFGIDLLSRVFSKKLRTIKCILL
nr:chromo domain-like protein [Tanacetum cinerariifolium]